MEEDTDKTRLIRKARPGQSQGGTPTPPALDSDATRMMDPNAPNPATPPLSGPTGDVDTDPTRKLSTSYTPPVSSPAASDDSDKTQLVRRSSSKSSDAATPTASTGQAGSSIHDPVTGWLVVIDGPGKGSQVAIGEQDNAVGRSGGSTEPRIALDFGDAGITRDKAFTIRYDPKKRRFKLLTGSGSNIVYLNDEDLDAPTQLSAGDVIEISDTKLRFVPFCGEGFDWSDTETSGGE